MDPLQVAVRASVAYLVLLALIRLGGKRTILLFAAHIALGLARSRGDGAAR